jgi:hypothetical protein
MYMIVVVVKAGYNKPCGETWTPATDGDAKFAVTLASLGLDKVPAEKRAAHLKTWGVWFTSDFATAKEALRRAKASRLADWHGLDRNEVLGIYNAAE